MHTSWWISVWRRQRIQALVLFAGVILNFRRTGLFTGTNMEVLMIVRFQRAASIRLIPGLQQWRPGLCSQVELTFRPMHHMQTRGSVWISHWITLASWCYPRRNVVAPTMDYINYKNLEGCQKRMGVCSIKYSLPNYGRTDATGRLGQLFCILHRRY